MFFSIFRLLKELRQGVDEMNDTLDEISDNLDKSLKSIRKTIIVLTNLTYPKTLHCELDIYILD